MIYSQEEWSREELYEDWLDPENSMPDLEEEYGIRRKEIRDVVADVHEPEFEFGGLTAEEEPV